MDERTDERYTIIPSGIPWACRLYNSVDVSGHVNGNLDTESRAWHNSCIKSYGILDICSKADKCVYDQNVAEADTHSQSLGLWKANYWGKKLTSPHTHTHFWWLWWCFKLSGLLSLGLSHMHHLVKRIKVEVSIVDHVHFNPLWGSCTNADMDEDIWCSAAPPSWENQLTIWVSGIN